MTMRHHAIQKLAYAHHKKAAIVGRSSSGISGRHRLYSTSAGRSAAGASSQDSCLALPQAAAPIVMAEHDVGSSHYVSIDALDEAGGVGGLSDPGRQRWMACIALVASVVELAAGLHTCVHADSCHGAPAWAVAVGTISCTACAAAVAALTSYADLARGPLEPGALFLFWWWCAGACTLTFFGPFIVVGNGWAATWLCAALSGLILYGVSSAFRAIVDEAVDMSAPPGPYVKALTLASTVELAAAAASCARTLCADGSSRAIVIGSCSLGACLFVTQPNTPTFAVGQLVWWSLSVCVLTVSGPFMEAGNGWIATWGALVASGLHTCRTLDIPLPSWRPALRTPLVLRPEREPLATGQAGRADACGVNVPSSTRTPSVTSAAIDTTRGAVQDAAGDAPSTHAPTTAPSAPAHVALRAQAEADDLDDSHL